MGFGKFLIGIIGVLLIIFSISSFFGLAIFGALLGGVWGLLLPILLFILGAFLAYTGFKH